ncbi:MAG: GNAT family N-acetyltransferase [Clostridiales bacterium]|nr:GNAT family N-acetyltransferase [Clostridiales bacterium]
MTNEITVREAATKQETAFFWEQLHAYFMRDMFPESDCEEREYFSDDSKYRAQIEMIRQRERDRCYYLLISRNGKDIGLALPVIYRTEDEKCFLNEFCVFPEFRGNGTGTECAKTFLAWAKAMGAAYIEINCDKALRQRFWKRLGFKMNGADEWGMPLMLLPPEEYQPVHVEILGDGKDWQLKKLENGYLSEIGVDILTEEKQESLAKAVCEGRITFFFAKRGYRAVGMCSVVTTFSTFACSDVGILENFYIEPVFRGQGIARMLMEAAQKWCRKNLIKRLSVTCAPCDEKMCRSLGFNALLGNTYAYLTEREPDI